MRQYLLGRQFILRTYHKSLKELLTQVIQTPEQQHYLRQGLRIQSGFKKSIEFGTTRPIRNQVDTVIRYETIRESAKTR